MRLNSGGSRMKAGRERIMKYLKKKYLIAGAFAAAAICAALFVFLLREKEPEEIRRLERPGCGEDERVYTLRARCGRGSYTVDFPVSAKRLSGDELRAAFDAAFEIICGKMPGDNPSLDEVRNDLVFAETVPEYGMTVDYTLEDYSVINSFGEVDNSNIGQDGAEYTVCARITYEDISQSYEIPVTVLGPEYTEEELYAGRIISELEKADGDGTGGYVELPQSIDGEKIVFTQEPENKAYIILLLALAAFAFWYYKKFVLRKRAEERREDQLRLDYSEIVSKLSLLMGAGMSGANAFARMGRDYMAGREEKGGPVRYAYEEIAAASNRMASGVSEAEAYASFGRACRLHRYIKLASLMAQNVVKGASGFNALLRAEASEAFAERKAIARRKGEEAGTKLLMPMVMMLGVVLIIIVVPAFMSF